MVELTICTCVIFFWFQAGSSFLDLGEVLVGVCKSFEVPLLNTSPCAVSFSLMVSQSISAPGIPEDSLEDPLGKRHTLYYRELKLHSSSVSSSAKFRSVFVSSSTRTHIWSHIWCSTLLVVFEIPLFSFCSSWHGKYNGHHSSSLSAANSLHSETNSQGPISLDHLL